MVSKASDDLPDPLTPVTTISLPAGRVRSTFLRLCVRAPLMTMAADAGAVAGMEWEGLAPDRSPEQAPNPSW